jgi:GNAT superfamily N-acetyltransferase
MTASRPATLADRDLVVRIAAAGFHDDPVLGWVFQDRADRRAKLEIIFGGLVDDMFPDRGVIHVAAEASVALWREPSFDQHRPASERVVEGEEDAAPSPFTDAELRRLGALGEAMNRAHPHEEHWYLNVVSTLPERQGRGLGAAVLQPVLERCDAEGHRAYLESTNPRNRSLYRRHGFIEADEIAVGDGPTMMQMWRDPRP